MTSKSDEWVIPDDVFEKLSSTCGPFELDACGRNYSKCSRSLQDALNLEHWKNACLSPKHVVWMNPPYSRGSLSKFTDAAYGAVMLGYANRVVMLVPAYPTERWFQKYYDLWNEPPGSRYNAPNVRMLSGGLMSYVSAPHKGLQIGIGFLRKRIRFLEPDENGTLHKAKYSARFGSAIISLEAIDRWSP